MFGSGNGSSGTGNGASSFGFGGVNQAQNSTSKPGGNLFGSTNNNNTGTQNGPTGLFGQANSSTNPSGQFGSSNMNTNTNASGFSGFGAGSFNNNTEAKGSNNQTATGNNAFGSTGSGLFGQTASQQPSSQNSGTSLFGGNGFNSSTSNKDLATTQPFGTSFGTAGSSHANQGPGAGTGASTSSNPGSNAGGGFTFGSKPGLGTSSTQPPTTGSLFGNPTAQKPNATSAEKPAASNGFSFGSNNNTASTGGLFGGQKTPTAAEPGSTSDNTVKPPGTSLFGTLGGSSNAPSSTTTAAKPSLFGNSATTDKKDETKAPSALSLGVGSIGAKDQQAAPSSSFSFGATKDKTSADQTKPAFGGGTTFGGAASTENKSESKPLSGFSFGNSLKTTDSKEDSTKPNTNEKSTESPKPASGFSFGAAPVGATRDEAKQTLPIGSNKDDSKTDSQDLKIAGAATTKPSATDSIPVQPGEYLKNKSFEDIIAKWTSALSKSVDRFQEQAAETAKWDQILVDNGERIAEIYNEVTVAEQAQTRIDDVLSYVSRQQDDIDAILSQVESQTSPSNSAGFVLDNLQPIDKERYEAYGLAEKLNDKVDLLQESLASIIGEMNELTRESHQVKESDPVSHIVKILNAHLGSLQFIDESANELQKKLVEAHSQSSRLRI